MHSQYENIGDQIYSEILDNCSSTKEAVHLARIYGLGEKYPEARVSRYRDLWVSVPRNGLKAWTVPLSACFRPHFTLSGSVLCSGGHE